MWPLILLHALLFAITNAPELIAIIKMILSFFQAHRGNPQLTVWIARFPKILEKCEADGNPQALQDFLAEISSQVKGAHNEVSPRPSVT